MPFQPLRGRHLNTRSTALRCLLAAATLPLVLAGCGSKPSAPEPARPNVLLIVWDTVRADHLSAYGYAHKTTPNLEAFANESLVFDNAVSDGMWTLPSHASLFTGLPVRSHGVRSSNKWLDDEFETVAEWLGAAGYDTYLFAANPHLQPRSNLTQGFDTHEYPWDPKWKAPSKRATYSKVNPDDASNILGPKWKGHPLSTGRPADHVKDAGAVTARALKRWLTKRPTPDAPFFATLNFMEAHVPRLPSDEARSSLWSEEQIKAQLELDQAYPNLLAYSVGEHEYSPDQIETISQTYDATLVDLDKATQQVLDVLTELTLDENTIVIITADHGEHLGEHHRIGHKYSLYNPLIRVPLLVRYPNTVSPGRSQRWVNTSQLFPSLAQWLTLPLPEGVPSASWMSTGDSRAFAELLEPTSNALKRLQPHFPTLDTAPYLHTYVSHQSDEGKCIRADDGTEQVFREADHLETTDLSGDPTLRTSLCRPVDEFISSTPSAVPSAAPAAPELSQEERARLEALGYLEPENTP